MQLWILDSFFFYSDTLPVWSCFMPNGPLWEEGSCLYPDVLQNVLGDGLAQVLEMVVVEERGERKLDDVIFQVP